MFHQLETNLFAANSRFVRPVARRSIANEWRLACAEAIRAGAAWFLMAKWPRTMDEGPAVVDDYGSLVCVGWTQ